MHKYQISPSLLSADFARLGEEASAILAAGADRLHLDVMDNHYVPNLTVGPLVCEALRRYGIQAPIDVHLMTKPVDRLINDFAHVGASQIVFHPEASDHIDRSLTLVRQQGCQAGLALNPTTTLHCLEYVLDKLDVIIVMSVNPGFSGQTFISTALNKIKEVRALIDSSGYPIQLAVDGGIKMDNIAQVARAGADILITGSAVFGHTQYAEVIALMRKQLTHMAV